MSINESIVMVAAMAAACIISAIAMKSEDSKNMMKESKQTSLEFCYTYKTDHGVTVESYCTPIKAGDEIIYLQKITEKRNGEYITNHLGGKREEMIKAEGIQEYLMDSFRYQQLIK